MNSEVQTMSEKGYIKPLQISKVSFVTAMKEFSQ